MKKSNKTSRKDILTFTTKEKPKIRKVKDSLSIPLFLHFAFLNLFKRSLNHPNNLSNEGTYWIGFFIGFQSILIIIIWVFCSNWKPADNHTIFEDEQVKEVEPIFRGAALLVIFLVFHAMCIVIWSRCHINYKVIFEYNSHFTGMNTVSF